MTGILLMPFTDDERAHLTAYLDGELDDAISAALEAKISVDPEARAETEALRQVWSLLDYLPSSKPSEQFTNRTLEKLSLELSPPSSSHLTPPPRLPSLRSVVGFGAAAVAASLLGFIGSSFLETTSVPPHDDSEEAIVRHLRILEHWDRYEHIDDLDFLRQLDQPGLFSEESGT